MSEPSLPSEHYTDKILELERAVAGWRRRVAADGETIKYWTKRALDFEGAMIRLERENERVLGLLRSSEKAGVAVDDQVASLMEWKESAVTLLTRYDDIAATFPGVLGSSKVENLENGVKELRLALDQAVEVYDKQVREYNEAWRKDQAKLVAVVQERDEWERTATACKRGNLLLIEGSERDIARAEQETEEMRLAMLDQGTAMLTLMREKATLAQEVKRVRTGLEESVALQSHYATSLNTWDGGLRLPFKDANDWLARLDAVKAGGVVAGEDAEKRRAALAEEE